MYMTASVRAIETITHRPGVRPQLPAQIGRYAATPLPPVRGRHISVPQQAVPIERAVLVRSLSGDHPIPESQVNRNLATDYFLAREGAAVFIIDKTLFETHRAQILEYEMDGARERMDARLTGKTASHKVLFESLMESVLAKKPGMGHLIHFGFMINEASKYGGDYLTAAAIMIHNLNDYDAAEILADVPRSQVPSSIRKEANNIRKNFRRLDGTLYRPPTDRKPTQKLRHFIQNFMNALICISFGDGRALLIRLVHRLSSLDALKLKSPDLSEATISREFQEKAIASTHEVFAPTAERLGLRPLAEDLDDIAFRIENEPEHDHIENETLRTLHFTSREEAEADADKRCQDMELALTESGYELSKLPDPRSRIKLPWSTRSKLNNKSDKYKKVEDLPDLEGVLGLTAKPLYKSMGVGDLAVGLEEAKRIVAKALGDDLFEIATHADKTETKIIEANGKRYVYYHVVAHVYTSAGKTETRTIEFHIKDEKTYKDLLLKTKPHWAHALEKATSQSFDFEELQACGELMTGDFFEDVKILYNYLSSRWIYVFFQYPGSSDTAPGLHVIRSKLKILPLDFAVTPIRAIRTLFTNTLEALEVARSYAGAKSKKVWSLESLSSPLSELTPLETGDCVSFNQAHRARPADAQRLYSRIAGRLTDPIARLSLHLAAGIEKDDDIDNLHHKGRMAIINAFRRKAIDFHDQDVQDRLTKVASKHELPLDSLYIILGLRVSFISIDQIIREFETISAN